MGAPIENQHAAKPAKQKRAGNPIWIYATPAERARIVKAANRAGQALSPFCLAAALAAAQLPTKK